MLAAAFPSSAFHGTNIVSVTLLIEVSHHAGGGSRMINMREKSPGRLG
jgi:hypothetical protein